MTLAMVFSKVKHWRLPVERLMNRKFHSVRSDEDQPAVLEMMRRSLLLQVPVLDDQGRVVDLLLLQELLNPQHLNAIVIMAGGKGTPSLYATLS